MSAAGWHGGRMTMRMEEIRQEGDEVQVVATFGGARVVRLRGGGTEIRGGGLLEQAEAREWASMFCHEAVLGRRRWR